MGCCGNGYRACGKRGMCRSWTPRMRLWRIPPNRRRRTEPVSAAPNPSPAPEAKNGRVKHRLIWRVALGVVVVVLLVILGGIWYMNTPQFSRFVRGKVISQLEQATGGRVQMGPFQWSLLHLEFTVNNLTIHGLEGPGQIPYLHVDRIYVRAKIISLFERKVGLNYLEVDRPVFHLIIYPDGTTNQPHPKVRSTNKKPVINTIFDLEVNEAQVRNGVAIVNQRAIPFNASGRHLGVIVNYVPAIGKGSPEKYVSKVHLEDLTLRRGGGGALHSTIDAEVALRHNE